MTTASVFAIRHEVNRSAAEDLAGGCGLVKDPGILHELFHVTRAPPSRKYVFNASRRLNHDSAKTRSHTPSRNAIARNPFPMRRL
jgi:hypothetical protein